MNRISLVGRLRTQKLLGRTVLILLAFSLLTVGGSYLFVRGEMVSRKALGCSMISLAMKCS